MDGSLNGIEIRAISFQCSVSGLPIAPPDTWNPYQNFLARQNRQSVALKSGIPVIVTLQTPELTLRTPNEETGLLAYGAKHDIHPL